MSSDKAYRQLPSRTAIGFELTPPSELELVNDGQAVRCCERREDGKPIGELEIGVFSAALIIDRDGVLSAKASQLSGGMPATPVKLPGASGYRAEAVGPAPLPYLYVFAMAPKDLGVSSAVLVTVRSAQPDWPAAEALLRSLRILTRNGVVAANEESGAFSLPLVGREE
ncbi:MAG TPA: hypothetical protein VIU61_28415 [Kofleriaceae bacterium]